MTLLPFTGWVDAALRALLIIAALHLGRFLILGAPVVRGREATPALALSTALFAIALFAVWAVAGFLLARLRGRDSQPLAFLPHFALWAVLLLATETMSGGTDYLIALVGFTPMTAIPGAIGLWLAMRRHRARTERMTPCTSD